MSARKRKRKPHDDLDRAVLFCEAENLGQIAIAARDGDDGSGQHPVRIASCDPDPHLADIHPQPYARAHAD